MKNKMRGVVRELDIASHTKGLDIPTRDLCRRAKEQLERANKIIGWMMPYIGNMAPPSNGIFDLNEHCIENFVPEPGKETKGAPLKQAAVKGLERNG